MSTVTSLSRQLRLARAVDEFVLATVLLFLAVTVVRWLRDPDSAVCVGDLDAALAVIGVLSGTILTGLILSPPGRRSGGHMNPAVTVSLWLMGAFPGRGVVPYVLAQCAGSAAGTGLARLVWGSAVSLPSVDYAAIVPAPAWQPTSVFVAEAGSMTIIIIAVGFAMAHARTARLVPYVIGLSVALVIAVLGPRSGGSINPAREFGPAALAGQSTDLWIYLIAPVLGAALGTWLHHVLSRRRPLPHTTRMPTSRPSSPESDIAAEDVNRRSSNRIPARTGLQPSDGPGPLHSQGDRITWGQKGDPMNHSVGTAVSEGQPTFEAADVPMALLDGEGTVVGWSRAAQRLVGYSAAEVVGQCVSILLMPATDQVQSSRPGHQNTLGGRGFDHAQVRHRDGHSIDVSLCVSSLSGRDGLSSWLVWATNQAVLPPRAAEGTGAVSLPGALPLPSRPPVGAVVRDTRLRCIWVDEIQASKDGIPLHQRLDRRLTEAAPGADAETLEAVMHQVLKSGSPALNVDGRPRMPAHGHNHRTLTTSFFRLDDAQGHALGVCAVSVDGLESGRARERLALLGEARKRIGTTLDVMQTGQELADLAVPLLADYVTVDLAESVPLGEEPLAHIAPQDGHIPVFRRAGLASIHPGEPESLFARGEPVFVPPTSPFTGVLRSGKSHFEPILDTYRGTWPGHHDAGRAQKIREHTMHSLMVIPIHARGAVLGVAVFVRTKNPRPFEEDDLLLAEELVSWSALALDNARQYTRERSAALVLQRLLLPHHVSGGSAADVAWRYLPADSHHGIGGDWFDVIPLSSARVALVVGDVVGHGISAAAKMGQLRTAVRTLADMDMPPDELLARLDEQITHPIETKAGPGQPAEPAMAATCLYAVYDPVTRCCTIARAGHPPPAIIDPHGSVTFPDLPAGAPLGLGLVPFESVTLELPEASVLALYTDGLIEARDQDLSNGMNRLRAALAPPGLTLEDLCSSAVDTLPTKTPSDDVTLLLARTRSFSPGQIASWQFPSTPAAVARARALATRQLTQWKLEHLAESTELIVSELVTNAIIHGNGDCISSRTIGLRLIRHEMLTCEVSDVSHSHPLLRHPGAAEEHGRGLHLVTELSRRWGTRHIPGGKVVWADQQLAVGT